MPTCAPSLIAPWAIAVATILGEAGYEPYLGKIAVAKTIRNRARLGYSSDGTVPGTVLRPLQFSLWNTHDRGRIRVCKAMLDTPAVRESHLAWFESAAHSPELGSAFARVVLYHADYVKPAWAKRAKFVRKIGRHIFYEDPAWKGQP